MLEHPELELFLCFVGLAGELAPKVCSGHWPSLEGTSATGQTEFLGAWVPLVPVTSSVGADVMSSSPLIMMMVSLSH